MVGKDAGALSRFEITPDKFRKWEDDGQITADIKKYGKILSKIRQRPADRKCDFHGQE